MDRALATLDCLPAPQSPNEEVGEEIRNRLRGRRSVGTVPPRDPVHRAKQREGEELRVALGEDAGLGTGQLGLVGGLIEARLARDVDATTRKAGTSTPSKGGR